MLKRTITGLLLAGFLVGMLFLREVSVIFFDALLILAMLVSVYELIRVFREHMTVPAIVITVLFALFAFPAYYWLGGISTVLISGIAAFAVLNIVLLFDGKATLQTTSSFLFMLFYPVLMLSLLFEVNHYADFMGGLLGLLLILVGSSLTDTFALLTGKAIGGKKLCPTISPKKTIAGAIGGLFGGMGGAVAVWAIFMESANAAFSHLAIPAWSVFLILGFIGAVLTQFGDLVASSLKRKVGVKDFGTIFPGHGGILDRIDGILYNGLLIYAFFAIFM